MSAFPHHGLARLARRLVAGEAVFFVGAGFSLDSEQNTAARLIARLLARFQAMTGYLLEEPIKPRQGSAREIRQRTRLLADGLEKTFRLTRKLAAKQLGRAPTLLDQAGVLADDYYTINDWLTSALAALAGELERLPRLQPVARALNARENEILAGIDAVPLEQLDFAALLELPPASRGKALFLDTMGFANHEIMRGPAFDRPFSPAEKTGGCLLPRHHVLARLAREGLSNTLLTTNYDLLLEWSYLLAGFEPREPGPGGRSRQEPDPRGQLAPATYRYLTRIAEAAHFFGRGDDHRAALIVKIHGCADRYRNLRCTAAWQRSLEAMVFTYREVQNWRQDSWSRDLVRTLQRTRTLVFCGYSTADPVLHDTFRSVYEEMAGRRPPGPPLRGRQAERRARRDARRAPAFFFGLGDRTEFHGLEILRAASRAVADGSPQLADHPNYLRFGRKDGDAFPDLDDLMLWLFHLTLRRCQAQALRSDLRRVACALLGHPCPPGELAAVERGFARLCLREKHAAGQWRGAPHAPGERAQLARIAGWTDRFQAGLLREIATAEAVQRNQGPGLKLEVLRRAPWYYPALEHPDWTAWTTVVELAVRRMVAAWRDAPDWAGDTPWVQAGAGPHPALLFARGQERPTPSCLEVRLAGFERTCGLPPTPGAFRHHRTWELVPRALPWRTGAAGPTPGADELWSWAAGTATEDSRAWLGE